MKVRIKKRKKFLRNTKKHFREKQDIFLQLKTLIHYRNRYVKLYYENNFDTRRKTDNI